jgi:hypothetical protein
MNPYFIHFYRLARADRRGSLPTLTGHGGEGSEGGQPPLSNKKCNRNDIIL